MDPEIKGKVLELFRQFDENGDGKLTESELSNILKAVSGGSMSEEEISDLELCWGNIFPTSSPKDSYIHIYTYIYRFTISRNFS